MDCKQKKLEKFNSKLLKGFVKLSAQEESLKDYMPLLKVSVDMKSPLLFSKFGAIIKNANAQRMVQDRDPEVLKHLPFTLDYDNFSQRSKTILWGTLSKLAKICLDGKQEQPSNAMSLVNQAMRHVPASFKPMIAGLTEGWTRQAELLEQLQGFEALIESSLSKANMTKQQIALFLQALHGQLSENLPPKLNTMAQDALKEIEAQLAAHAQS